MIDVQECPFCEIVQREDPDAREVYRDEHVVAFFPLEPATLGHTLVVPRHHISDIWSLDDELARHLGVATTRLSQVVKHVLRPEASTSSSRMGELPRKLCSTSTFTSSLDGATTPLVASGRQ